MSQMSIALLNNSAKLRYHPFRTKVRFVIAWKSFLSNPSFAPLNPVRILWSEEQSSVDRWSDKYEVLPMKKNNTGTHNSEIGGCSSSTEICEILRVWIFGKIFFPWANFCTFSERCFFLYICKIVSVCVCILFTATAAFLWPKKYWFSRTT